MAGKKASPNVKWNRERHKPFKGSSKSKASKKGRMAKESFQKKPTKAELSKVDRKNASKIAQRHKKETLLKQRELNALVKPVVTILALSKGNHGLTLDAEVAKVNFFLHGSFIPNILDAIRASDVLLLLVAPTEPSDEWSENVQFSIRFQGCPPSVAIILQDEIVAFDQNRAINEWATYLSDRYSGSVMERKKHVFIFPMQKPELGVFISNAERRNVSRSSYATGSRKNALSCFVIESFFFNAENQSATFNGFIRGGRGFSANDAIIVPGISKPFHKWRISSDCAEMNNGISSTSWEACSCCDVQEEQHQMANLSFIKTPSLAHPTSQKSNVNIERISDYQSMWLCEEDEENEDLFDTNNAMEFEQEEQESACTLSSNHQQMDDAKEVEDQFDDESGDIISLPPNVLAKDFLSE